MIETDIEQAIQLYRMGNSLAAVGSKLGYDPGTSTRRSARPVWLCVTVMAGNGDHLTAPPALSASQP
jgi:hypothetical protein